MPAHLQAATLSQQLPQDADAARTAEPSLQHALKLRPTHRHCWRAAVEHYGRLATADPPPPPPATAAGDAAAWQAGEAAKWRLCMASSDRVESAVTRNAGESGGTLVSTLPSIFSSPSVPSPLFVSSLLVLKPSAARHLSKRRRGRWAYDCKSVAAAGGARGGGSGDRSPVLCS